MRSRRKIEASASRGRLLSLRLPGRPCGVRDALGRIRQGLTAAGLSGSDLSKAEIVLAEVLNNIVEHALTDRTGKIRVEIRPAPEALVFDIFDRGRPMPGGEVPVAGGVPGLGSWQDLPEGGFGWPLIRQLVQDLSYAREEGTNHLSFRLIRNGAETESVGVTPGG